MSGSEGGPSGPPVVWAGPDQGAPGPPGGVRGSDPLSTAAWSGGRMVVRTRHLEALVVGVASAGIAGVAWWAAVATTERQFFYLAIVLGLLVGHGTLIGARRGGVGPAAVAGLATLVALAVAEYFIARSLAISRLGVDVPLWSGFEVARDVVRESLEAEPLAGLFWGLATLVAVAVCADRSRRPVI